MALFHLSVTQTKRSAGQSAIASAAYRAGERLYSEYYGEYSDYTRKGGVICSDILLPSHAPPEYADRQTLWNAVEKAERGKNAQLAYSFDIALQNEFSLEENIALARQFLLENFVSRGMVVDFAVHQPDREDGGIPNPHFHVLCPIRPIEQNGKWGLKQRRVYELDEDGNRIRDANGKFVFNAVPTTDWGSPETLEYWRQTWAELCNAKFAEKGLDVGLDLIAVNEMESGTMAATVAGLGAPSNVDMQKFEDDLPGAFAALKEGFRVEDKNLSYLYSGEMGGLNTMVPIMLHIVSSKTPDQRIKVVDADANGRAVPELNTCLVTARGFPPAPVGIQGHDKGVPVQDMSRYVAWTRKKDSDTAEDIAKTAEGIARSLAIQYGQVGFSTWALTSGELKEDACPQCMSLANSVGQTLNVGTPYSEEKLTELKSFFDNKIHALCLGTVKSFKRDVSAGFDVGETVIAGEDGKEYKVSFQNENIVAYEDGKACITVPDRICIIDYNTCMPLTNVDEDMKIGRKIVVIISASPENWWKSDKNAYKCWNPILDRVSYSGKFIDYNGNEYDR